MVCGEFGAVGGLVLAFAHGCSGRGGISTPPTRSSHQNARSAKRHAEAQAAYRARLRDVRDAIDAWMLKAGGGIGAASPGDTAAGVRDAAVDDAFEAAVAATAAAAAAASGGAQPPPQHGGGGGGSSGRELRLLVDQLTASMGGAGSASSTTAAAAAAAANNPRASQESLTVLRAAAAAVEAVEMASPPSPSSDSGGGRRRGRRSAAAGAPSDADAAPFAVARGGGGSRRPPLRRIDSARMRQLPAWKRFFARQVNRLLVFRQQIDEDPAYADAVSHRCNKVLALTQFAAYNVCVALIFVLGTLLHRPQ